MPTHDFSDIGDVLNFELLRGTITAIDAATDTCTVTVGGKPLSALLFYHCATNSIARASGAIEGAAKGFSIGNEVIVLKRNDDGVVKVIGHINGVRRCVQDSGDYFAISNKSGIITIDKLSYGETINVADTKTAANVYSSLSSDIIKYHCKRFTHNVATNGVTAPRDLYFIATSLCINQAPFPGWTAFAAANPTFALVTNNANTQITMTDQVMTDLNTVNAAVNAAHVYSPEYGGNDNWHILTGSESGDCEDFALTKAKALLDMGYPASAIHFEAGIYLDEEGTQKGHGWLVVQTTAGNFALDIGSDAVISNTSMTFMGAEYYARRRQIGNNWASVSGYGWMLSSENSPLDVYWYILDPLLNILYPINYNTDMGTPFYDGAAINFSIDGNSIYVQSADNVNHIYNITEYKLAENRLDTIGSTPYTNSGYFVGRDGLIAEPPDTYQTDGYNYRACRTTEVCSMDGYYGYNFYYETSEGGALPPIDWGLGVGAIVEEGMDIETDTDTLPAGHSKAHDAYVYQIVNIETHGLVEIGRHTEYAFEQVVYYPHVLMGKVKGSALYDYKKDTYVPNTNTVSSRVYYHNFLGENLNESAISDYTAEYTLADWCFVDVASALIQSLTFTKTGVSTANKRMQRNGLDCLASICAAVGVGDTNLLGLAYLPLADRINN